MSLPVKEISISIEIPVAPISRREIKQLETALILGTVFRPDVVQTILSGEELTTWLDSLAVAAAALAMDKAGYPISRIAEELGRTEATIRKHLKGETKAGKLVRETYEMLARGELKLSIPVVESAKPEEFSRLSKEVEDLKKENAMLKSKLEELKEDLKSIGSMVEKIIENSTQIRKIVEKIEKS
ncbi:hypothetical protein QPL79_02025 [Ignisphaera sp. 4213-co]|uniref:Transcriptional regulator n=1 Tax=Ignisphaera cupida TaxID=3050454 RepID=A0ABD4Z596_9CREN|nr:hypothetical protein [Ignisphaera sp. 4213-co]MDK6028142.1 hypothetical protein [Ignisphaera sp. 4213-co]